MNVTNDYDSCISCTDNEYNEVKIIIKYLPLSIPSNILLFFIIGRLYKP